MKTNLLGVMVVAGLGLAACSGSEPPPPDPGAGGSAASDGLGEVRRELGPGSRGPDVRAIQEYLRKFGYFPDPGLARAYPQWRPIVPVSPAVPGVFDQSTEAAIRAFQHGYGLPETGRVDSGTLVRMLEPRCGVPDGLTAPDPTDKFSLFTGTWTKTALTWALTDIVPGVSSLNARAAIARAFASWAGASTLTFTESGSTSANIRITRADLSPDCAPPKPGQASDVAVANSTIPNGADAQTVITLNNQCSFSIGGSTFDLETVIVHEIGHSLGFGHSSAPTAVMLPNLPSPPATKRTLTSDDKVAVQTRYDRWEKLPGCARDIALNGSGDAWIIGCTPVGNSFNILKWNGSAWVQSNGAGSRIALGGNGIPWVGNHDGDVFVRTSSDPSTGGWNGPLGSGPQLGTRCAIDVGAGADNTVWKIGCESVPGGSFVYKWNGSDWALAADRAPGTAVAVDLFGRPWIVSSGIVLHRTTNDPANGTWVGYPGLPGGVFDIGVDLTTNALSYAWTTSRNETQNVYALDEQSKCIGGAASTIMNGREVCPGGLAPVPDVKAWVLDRAAPCNPSSRAIQVSASLSAVWTVNAAGEICRKVKR